MLKRLFGLGLILVLSFVLACATGESKPNNEYPDPESVIIAGTVINSRTGKPVSDVKASIMKGDEAVYETFTDEDGSFKLIVNPNLPIFQTEGRLAFEFMKEGFEILDANPSDDIFLIDPVLLDERQNDQFEYNLYGDKTIELKIYKKSNADSAESRLIIPETIDGIPITSIGDYCFYYNGSNLEHVQLPNGIIRIGIGAFFKCNSLKSVTIPAGVIHIDNGAFGSCTALADIILPDTLLSIGDDAFSDTLLTSVTIPDSVVNMGNNPFSRCPIDSFIVTDNHPYLEVREKVLFSKPDHRLISYPITLTDTAYSIPQGTDIVGHNSFLCCESLESVIIPDEVTKIEEGAFFMCSNLVSVTIPTNVSYIGKDAFGLCSRNLVFIVDSGSFAEQYCIDHSRPYTLK